MGDYLDEEEDIRYSELLFARPSFLSGLGRVFDVGGVLTRYNTVADGEEADLIAARMDRMALARDARTAGRLFAARNSAETGR